MRQGSTCQKANAEMTVHGRILLLYRWWLPLSPFLQPFGRQTPGERALHGAFRER